MRLNFNRTLLFVTSVLVAIVMIASKMYFFGLEPEFAKTAIAKVEMISLFILILLGIYFFIKNDRDGNGKSKAKEQNEKTKGKAALMVGLSILISISVVSSFWLNATKESIHWDAVALYDARAKFLEDGMRFSEMPELAKYDNLNKYYYLLYPPFTSIAHYAWENISLTKDYQVSIFYSLVFIVFLSILFLVSKNKLGTLPALLLTFLVSWNSSTYNVVVKEYTNLPFNLYIVSGILLLYLFIYNQKKWQYVIGILLVVVSLWVRLLEPIWIAVVLAYFLSTLERGKVVKSFVYSGIFFAFGVLEYFAWSQFASNIAKNPGFMNFNLINIIDPFVGVFTGAPIEVVITVARTWGIPFIIHLSAMLALILRAKHVINNKPLLFLGLVVFISEAIYFAEFYILSFQFDWWSTIALSLDRSSTFLLPISGLILIELIYGSGIFQKTSKSRLK